MALRAKRSPSSESVPIQDYAGELIAPLPESIKKFPGMAEWEAKTKANFDALLKRLWEKDVERAGN